MNSPDTPILRTIDLKKSYRVGKIDVPALRGVTLDVKEGEFVAVMGPSGCGKSTLLHLLGGLLSPTSGSILIDGEDLSKVSDARRTDIRRRKIGFVFQRFNLFPTLSAEGNLKLAEKIHTGNGSKNSDRRREVLTLLKLEDKMHHKPLELSGGEQQRVALAAGRGEQPGDHPRRRADGQSRHRELADRPRYVSPAEREIQPDDHHDHPQPRGRRRLLADHSNDRRACGKLNF